MGVSKKYVFQQGDNIALLGRFLLQAAKHSIVKGSKEAFQCPGPKLTADVKPRSAQLVRDYLMTVGARPESYEGRVPSHLFPQWGFPLIGGALRGVPYPVQKILNGGCRLQLLAPIPSGETLKCAAHLEGIDDNGRRAVLHTHFTTGTDSVAEAIVCDFYSIVPLGGGSGSDGAKKEKPRVPVSSRELERWRLTPADGMDFALLTGDFNPVHWMRTYARASGFKSTILHGFATMARAIEGVNQGLLEGDVDAMATVDVRFTRPLVLPADVGLYVDEQGGMWVGDAPGSPAYMVGSYTLRDSEESGGNE